MKTLLATLCFATLISCQNNGGSTNAEPQPNAAPAAALSWTDVARSETCSPPSNAPMCIHGVFTVQANGKFSFASDALAPKQGTLAELDFQKLDRMIDAISPDSVKRDATCLEIVSIPEIHANHVAVTFTGREKTILKEFGPNGMCYRIEQIDADGLERFLEELTTRYAGPWQ